MIEHYRFGIIVIDGQDYTSDVTLRGAIVRPWRRLKGHNVAPVDIEAVVAEKPEILIIGTGAMSLMRVSNEARQFIEESGITLYSERTASAVKRFNEMCAEGANLAIAMHLTC